MKLAVIKTKFGYIKKTNRKKDFNPYTDKVEYEIEFTDKKSEACTHTKRSIGNNCEILMTWQQDNNLNYEFSIEQIME